MPLGFECPGCGEVNGFDDDVDPDDIEGDIFPCGGCGEKVLLAEYVPGGPDAG